MDKICPILLIDNDNIEQFVIPIKIILEIADFFFLFLTFQKAQNTTETMKLGGEKVKFSAFDYILIGNKKYDSFT